MILRVETREIKAMRMRAQLDCHAGRTVGELLWEVESPEDRRALTVTYHQILEAPEVGE